jgi:hypothetical protein
MKRGGAAGNPLLPCPDLPGANWADRYSVTTPRAGLSALEATQIAIGAKPPGWVQFLMTMRNSLGAMVGLKAAEISVDQKRMGAFPIVSETANKVVLGFDDWHLDFRIVVETAEEPGKTCVSVSTIVKRKNWFGRAYIFVITPFHRLIVRQTLSHFHRLETPKAP